MQYTFFKKGFTLIELMVVIAIIGILTAIITANFPQAKAKSRDAKRISDLAQIQLTLELAFDKCGKYPPNISGGESVEIDGSNCKKPGGGNYTIGDFITKIPKDGSNSYEYGASSGNRYDYRLGAKLEVGGSIFSESAPDAYSTGCGATVYCVSPN